MKKNDNAFTKVFCVPLKQLVSATVPASRHDGTSQPLVGLPETIGKFMMLGWEILLFSTPSCGRPCTHTTNDLKIHMGASSYSHIVTGTPVKTKRCRYFLTINRTKPAG